MDTPATLRMVDSLSVITMDDGKANALSPTMLTALNGCLDEAAAAGGPVVLVGRSGRFSGGFDLKVLGGGGEDAKALLRAGFELSHRLLSFPTPVVLGCTGHAIAMGVFVLLSGDYRIGASGPFKLAATETALGMTMPYAAIEICKQRLNAAEYNRAILLSQAYTPEQAVVAGILDAVVPAEDVELSAIEVATQLATLNMRAHAASKMRIRSESLATIKAAIDQDAEEFRIAP
jgi:enoyl-CoA hydratase